MDHINDDDRFLGAVVHMVLEALTAIGDEPQARFAHLRRLLTVAHQVTRQT